MRSEVNSSCLYACNKPYIFLAMFLQNKMFKEKVQKIIFKKYGIVIAWHGCPTGDSISACCSLLLISCYYYLENVLKERMEISIPKPGNIKQNFQEDVIH